MMAGDIRKFGYIVIKGRPCQVTDVETSKTGKHGHAKCHFKATDIFTGKLLDDLIPATHNTQVPFVKRLEYQVLGIDEDEREVHGLTDVGGTTTIKVLDGPLTVDDATLPSWEIWVRCLRPRPPSESPPTFTHTHASRPPWLRAGKDQGVARQGRGRLHRDGHFGDGRDLCHGAPLPPSHHAPASSLPLSDTLRALPAAGRESGRGLSGAPLVS